MHKEDEKREDRSLNESIKTGVSTSMTRTFEIKLSQIPAGIALSNARKEDGKALIQTRGFLSWEDGEQFHNFLDSFPSEILRALPENAKIYPENVGSFIAVIHPDMKAQVIVKPQALATIQTGNRDVKKGEPVFESDILDVRKLEFVDVKVPDDCGILLVLAHQWRRGCYFDFGPLILDKIPRDFNLADMFGALWRRLFFSNLYLLSDPDWERFFAQKWFPFSAINPGLRKQVISAVRNDIGINEYIDKLKIDVDAQIDGFEQLWRRKESFRPHLEFFLKSLSHYKNNDYLSCISILIPRIEGLMRTVLPTGTKRDQKTFSRIVSSGSVKDPMSALFPEKFQLYLETVFFASFDPEKPDGISRNTVSHGVAPYSCFDLEAALRGILTLQQIAYCLPESES